MAKPADSAALFVSAEHALAETALVEALADHRGDVLPPSCRRGRVIELPGGWCLDLVVDRHDEGEGLGMVLDAEHRPRRLVEALDDTVKIDEWGVPLHGEPQADVVSMLGVSAAVAIAEEPAVDKSVVVETVAMLDGRRGRDGEW